MLRFLILGDIWKDNYSKSVVTVKDLADRKSGNCDTIIDTHDGTIFNPDKNEWEDITEEN